MQRQRPLSRSLAASSLRYSQPWANERDLAPDKILKSREYIDLQVIELPLEPGQTITTEPGTMLYMSSNIELDADTGGLGQACLRCCCAGESFIRLKFKNNSNTDGKVAFTPNFPAMVVPLEGSQHDGLIFNKGAFLGAVGDDWKVDLKMVGSLGVACCAGQGLFMNTLHAKKTFFLNAGGTVLKKVLDQGEELIVDKHSVLAFDRTVQLEIRRAGEYQSISVSQA
jgi:uncharacterized protein (AIM24 family)